MGGSKRAALIFERVLGLYDVGENGFSAAGGKCGMLVDSS